MTSTFDTDFQAWVDGGQEGPMPSAPQPVKRQRRRKADDDCPDIFETIGKEMRKLHLRIEALESRVQEQRHVGVWSEGMIAKPGNSCSHQGSTWICLEQTDKKPGTENSGWILSVKRGRDGKDAKP